MTTNNAENFQKQNTSSDDLLDNATLFDDDFFKLCFKKDKKYLQEVIRTIFDHFDLETIELDKVRLQERLDPFREKSVIFDALAHDKSGRKINIEIQKIVSKDIRQRARFYSSILDTSSLQRGQDYEKLPETFVVFITGKDAFGANKPAYRIERMFFGSEELFDAGDHIIFVNGAWRGDDPIGQLMKDFSTADPKEITNPLLAEMIGYYKIDQVGRDFMKTKYDELFEQALEQRVGQVLEQRVGQVVEQRLGQALEQRDEQLNKKWQQVLQDNKLQMAKELLKSKLPLSEIKRITKLSDAQLDNLAHSPA